MHAEKRLPHELLARATLLGKEYAWPLSDIPHVIEAAVAADLVTVGGQLQFRFPNGGTCECYWVQVDTYRTVPSDLPWEQRVPLTARAALSQFRALEDKFDFMAEGRRGFEDYFQEREALGDDPRDAMCFVWYVKARNGGAGEGDALR